MEIVTCKLGAFFGMKKMDFSKVETSNLVEDIHLQETAAFKVNEIKNPDVKRLFNIDRNLANIWNEMKERAVEETKEIKWKYAAIVLDRLFFFVTLLYSIITFCSTVLSIPNLYRFT